MLIVIDKFTRESLAIRVNRWLKAVDVIDVLSDLLFLRGIPGHVRSDRPAFIAKAVRIERWRREYNMIRPHSLLGYRPPAPEVVLWQGTPVSSGSPPVTPTLAPRPLLN